MAKKKSRVLEHYYKRGKYVPMYHDVWDSDAFRSLTPKAKCLLYELQRAEFPNRNGGVVMSEKRASRLLNCAENTASVAFDELIDRGFIKQSFEADYGMGLAREWVLTYLPCGGREATHEWKLYKEK